MALARKPHTLGSRIRYTLDYSDWLPPGVTVATAVITSGSTTLTVDDVVVGASGHVYFFVNDGALAEVADVTVTVTDSLGEIKIDVITFFVISP